MADQAQDQSMEEILQSIKRIISEEEAAESKAPLKQAAPEDDTGEDVLDLEDLAAPGDVMAEAMFAGEEPIADEPQAPIDVLSDIDALLSAQAVESAASALQSLKQPKPAPSPAPQGDALRTRAGNTVEDLMLEALRPMLKEWLDANLPATVERLVQREIAKISGQS